MLAHNPGIIKSFSSGHLRCLLPFHLWHRTGFTIPLLEYVTDMCDSGMSLRHVESILSSNRLRLYYKLTEILLATDSGTHISTFLSYTTDCLEYWKSSPGHHAVCALYLMDFWQWENTYHLRMSQTSISPTSNWLSCDHTFKSVRNVGIIRYSDDNWIQQYKGLFCVLNAAGQIVTWKMTKGLAVTDVKDMLHKLQERFHSQGICLEEFYVDNCCALRQKLQCVFGQGLLRYFHAIQRITKKRHPYHFECSQSLRFVFRDPADRGELRTMPTPAVDQLKLQLLQFKEEWEGVTYNGKHVLPPAAIAEIQSLLVHIQKGCLSGILPGRGTNRNERLHRNLNSLMSNSKYGVEFAYSLLTSSLFKHK